VFTVTQVVANPTGDLNQASSGGSTSQFFHNTGAVAGVFVVAGILVAAVLAVVGYLFWRRRKRARLAAENPFDPPGPQPRRPFEASDDDLAGPSVAAATASTSASSGPAPRWSGQYQSVTTNPTDAHMMQQYRDRDAAIAAAAAAGRYAPYGNTAQMAQAPPPSAFNGAAIAGPSAMGGPALGVGAAAGAGAGAAYGAYGAGAAAYSTSTHTPSDQYTTPDMDASVGGSQMLHSRNPSDEAEYVYAGTTAGSGSGSGGSPEFDPYKGFGGSSEEHGGYLAPSEVHGGYLAPSEVPYHDDEPYHDDSADDPAFWKTRAAWEANLPHEEHEIEEPAPAALRVTNA